MPGNCISLSSECKNLTISFVKGWGRSYRRQEVTDCPAWLEILLWLVAYESKFHANVIYLTFVKKNYSVLLKYIQYRGMSHIYDSSIQFHLLHILRFAWLPFDSNFMVAAFWFYFNFFQKYLPSVYQNLISKPMPQLWFSINWKFLWKFWC